MWAWWFLLKSELESLSRRQICIWYISGAYFSPLVHERNYNPVFDVSLCNYFGSQKWKRCLSVLFSVLLVVMDNFRSPILVFPELALRLQTIISVQLTHISITPFLWDRDKSAYTDQTPHYAAFRQDASVCLQEVRLKVN